MPPKDINKMPTLFIETVSGKRVKLGSVSGWTKISEPSIYDGNVVINTCPDELTLEIRQSSLTLDAIHLLVRGRLPSNNWLKEHRWPLMRKARRRNNWDLRRKNVLSRHNN